jgi:hypothetical protein
VSLSAAIIDALIEAGATAEMLGAAFKAELAADEAKRALKRAGNAERQRRKRANVTPVTRDNVEQRVTVRDPSHPLPPEPPNPRSSVRDISTREGFVRFWTAYPRKVAKPEAERAFLKAIAKIGGPDPPDVLVQAIARMAPDWTDPKFIPHPATWLNREGWNDEPTPQARSHERPDKPSRDDRLGRALAGAMDHLDELERRDGGGGGGDPFGPSGPGGGEGGFARLAGPLQAVR